MERNAFVSIVCAILFSGVCVFLIMMMLDACIAMCPVYLKLKTSKHEAWSIVLLCKSFYVLINNRERCVCSVTVGCGYSTARSIHMQRVNKNLYAVVCTLIEMNG